MLSVPPRTSTSSISSPTSSILRLPLPLLLVLPLTSRASPSSSFLAARQNSNDASSSSSSTASSAPAKPSIAIFIALPIAIFFLLLGWYLAYMTSRRPRWKAQLKKIFRGESLAPVPEHSTSDTTSSRTRTTTASVSSTATVTETGEARTDGLGLSGNGVTEESLAGMTPAERQAAINLADARRNARAERARRQGSQRSVKSLPRYTYDVDPQEMILIKGEDTLAEDFSDEEFGTHPDARRNANGYPRSRPSIDMHLSSQPLLPLSSNSSSAPLPITITPASAPPTTHEFHPDGDLGAVSMIRGLGMDRQATEGRPRNSSVSTMRQSFDTQGASSTGSNDDLLLRGRGWGEAPAYETGGREEMLVGSPSGETSSRGPSRFTKFFSRNHRPAASSSGFSRSSNSVYQSANLSPPNPALSDLPRASSSSHHLAQPSSTSSNSSAPSSTRPTHRTTHSLSTLSAFGSSSVSLLLRPTASRQSVSTEASSSRLDISNPIQVSKTRWEHPKGGMTAAQMKFISSTDNLGKYAVPVSGSPSSRHRPLAPEAPPPSFEYAASSSIVNVNLIDGLPSTSSTAALSPASTVPVASDPDPSPSASRAPLLMPKMDTSSPSSTDRTQQVSEGLGLTNAGSGEEDPDMIRPASPPHSPPRVQQQQATYSDKEEEAWGDGSRRTSQETRRASPPVPAKAVLPPSPPPSPPRSDNPPAVSPMTNPARSIVTDPSTRDYSSDFYSPAVIIPSTTSQPHDVLADLSSPTTPTVSNPAHSFPHPSQPQPSTNQLPPSRSPSSASDWSDADSFHSTSSTINGRHRSSTRSGENSMSSFEDAEDGRQLHEIPEIRINTASEWQAGRMQDVELTPVERR